MPRIKFEGMTYGQAELARGIVLGLTAGKERSNWREKIRFDMPAISNRRMIWRGEKERPFILLAVDPNEGSEEFVREIIKIFSSTRMDIEVMEVRFIPHK